MRLHYADLARRKAMVERKNAKLEAQIEMLEEKIKKGRYREKSLIYQLRGVITKRLEPSRRLLEKL